MSKVNGSSDSEYGAPQVRAAASSSLPIPTRHVARTILGHDTHVVCQSFTDRICIFISQVGKLGCIMQATVSTPAHFQPSSSDLDFDDEEEITMARDARASSIPLLLPSTSLQTLLGSPPHGYSTLYPLMASHVASLVTTQATSSSKVGGRPSTMDMAAGGNTSRPIIISLGLRRLASSQSAVDEDGEDAFESSEEEQVRFHEILQMVSEASVW
ncbi:hypothetical protein K437DRAFT_273252 [Tilletiaria anomala UBC 951]|uniref:Proteasome assembly chaperone 3 n=1 Tax=Tilletiaria anomala (strain ATCC 24038 / CBS 436.72 / UBC 951) TaxID=1037660 RepID=A0A066W6J6_TILAU|nr:uncharacterized protein K437DRAFT_273252 [Tilletiaria anomala UBC 951]KDN49602.1 hypothetical protein K437DRAFT_273252 [Tilletiaria anomala UBC 951]